MASMLTFLRHREHGEVVWLGLPGRAGRRCDSRLQGGKA
jgi:hypothetical protein